MEPTLRGHGINGVQLFHAMEMPTPYGGTHWLASGKRDNGIIVFIDMESVISHYLIDFVDTIDNIEYTDQMIYVVKRVDDIFPQTKAGLIAKTIQERVEAAKSRVQVNHYDTP
jgi:hypothetical protein